MRSCLGELISYLNSENHQGVVEVEDSFATNEWQNQSFESRNNLLAPILLNQQNLLG